MIETICVVIFCGIIYVLFDSERDAIIFVPSRSWFPNWAWWVKLNKNRSWLVKYVLSFLADGFHYTKAAGLYIICMQGAYAISQHVSYAEYYQQWLFIFGISIALFATFGVMFNLFYHKLTTIIKSLNIRK